MLPSFKQITTIECFVVALASIIHPARIRPNIGPVPKEALLKAIEFSEYLKTHAVRVYESGETLAKAEAAKSIIDKIYHRYLRDGFTSRNVTQNDWKGLSEPKIVHAGLDLLVECGWLQADKKVPGAKGGRSTVAYRINPACYEKHSES